MTEILFRQECYRIQGAVFDVYRKMGCGFLEAVYQECLAREFAKQSIPFVEQPELRLMYGSELLSQTYKPDFICYEEIIVEIKAVKDTTDAHKAQLINYLKASGLRVGLLANFGTYPKATVTRLVK